MLAACERSSYSASRVAGYMTTSACSSVRFSPARTGLQSGAVMSMAVAKTGTSSSKLPSSSVSVLYPSMPWELTNAPLLGVSPAASTTRPRIVRVSTFFFMRRAFSAFARSPPAPVVSASCACRVMLHAIMADMQYILYFILGCDFLLFVRGSGLVFFVRLEDEAVQP